MEGGRERDDFFLKFCFFIVEWLGTGGQGFFFNMLKGDGREFFFFFFFNFLKGIKGGFFF